MEQLRDMRLDILQKLYARDGDLFPMDVGDIVGRVEIHNEDEKYVMPSSFNILGMQDDEIVFFASGDRLDGDRLRTLMEDAARNFEDLIVQRKKLRSTTMTVVMVYDSADPDVIKTVEKHDHKVNHKLGFGGWTIHRVALLTTDSGEVFADKRCTKKVLYRLDKVAGLKG